MKRESFPTIKVRPAALFSFKDLQSPRLQLNIFERKLIRDYCSPTRVPKRMDIRITYRESCYSGF